MTSLEKIKAKLDALKKPYNPDEKKEYNKNTWKPEKGKNSIRILPNFAISKDPSERPFVPLYFYYDFGQTWLAPYQFDRPDPIHDMCMKLYKEKDDDSKALAKKLNGKLRIAVPVLVRGKESDGVKWWLFSKTVYLKIDALYDDPDWGNISDLNEGVDIVVEYTPDESNPVQSKTEIVPNRKSSVATNDPDVLLAIQNIPDVSTVFTEPTAEQLLTALESYLGVERKPVEVKAKPTLTEKQEKFDPDLFVPKSNKSIEIDDVEQQFQAILDAGKK